MLGIRAYNSHTGQTGFGAEIIGVRWLCSNMCAFGDILGKCSWKHFVSEDDVVSVVGGMIESYMDKVPTLQDKIDAMRNEIIGINDAEDLLWGAKLSPFRIEGIMAHLPELNPEIKAMAEISVYDIFNAICVGDLGFGVKIFPQVQFDPMMKDRVLKEILSPESDNKTPKSIFLRIPFKYRRWRANAWKHELCFSESLWSAFWSGVKSHLMKPSSI